MAQGFDEYFQATIRHELGDETLERVLPATVIEVNAPAHQLHLSLLGHDIGWVKYGLGQANPGDTVALHETFDGDRWVKLAPTGSAWCKLWTTDLDFDAGSFDPGLVFPARADQGDKTGQLQCRTTEIYGDGRDGAFSAAAGTHYLPKAQGFEVTAYGGFSIEVDQSPEGIIFPGDLIIIRNAGGLQPGNEFLFTYVGKGDVYTVHDVQGGFIQVKEQIPNFTDPNTGLPTPYYGDPSHNAINLNRVPQFSSVVVGGISTLIGGGNSPDSSPNCDAGIVALVSQTIMIGGGFLDASAGGAAGGATANEGSGRLQPTFDPEDCKVGGDGGFGGGQPGWLDGCVPLHGDGTKYYVGSGGGGGGGPGGNGADGQDSTGGGLAGNIGEPGGVGGPGGPGNWVDSFYRLYNGAGGGGGGLNPGTRGGNVVYAAAPAISCQIAVKGGDAATTGGAGGGGTFRSWTNTAADETSAVTLRGGFGGQSIAGNHYTIGGGGNGGVGIRQTLILANPSACWTSDVLTSASLGLTPNLPITPGTFKADWQLDGDLLVPSFTLQSSPTGAWAGEQTAYSLATVGHNGEWVQMNLLAALYWRVVACLQVGSNLTDTPYIFDIQLCGRA